MNFVATVVIDERAPVGMSPLARIGMLVEMRPVELRKTVRVAREMRGSPIEKNAEAGLMAAVDKFHEISGSAEAASSREIAERLVAPGTVVRMLHDGEQLDVRIAEVFDIWNELVAEFVVVEPAIVIFRHAAPGAEMNFVNGNRRLKPVFLRTMRNPIGVVPFVVIEACNDGASVRA